MKNNKLCVVFFGSSDYCLPILEALHQNPASPAGRFNLKLVVTRPDKPVGRKQIMTPSAVKLWAQKKGVEVVSLATLKKDASDRKKLYELLNFINPDLAVVSDYGLIIPEGIFKLPKLGTLNVHFSKLPDLRGPSPVQTTLFRGDKKAWITIFKLENPPELEIKMDSGPIYFQKGYSISPEDTTQTLYTRLFIEAAKELPKVIRGYISDKIRPQIQDHSQATFCHMLTRDNGFVKYEDLQQAVHSSQFTVHSKSHREPSSTVNSVYNRYRAMYPWPGLWTLRSAQGKPQRMKILKCHLEKNKLVLDQVQFEGEKPKKYEN